MHAIQIHKYSVIYKQEIVIYDWLFVVFTVTEVFQPLQKDINFCMIVNLWYVKIIIMYIILASSYSYIVNGFVS